MVSFFKYRITAIATFAVGVFLISSASAHAGWRDDLPDGLRLNVRYMQAGGYAFDRPYLGEGLFAEGNLRFNGLYRLNPDWKLNFACQLDGTYYEGLSLSQMSGGGGLVNLDWLIDEKTNWSATQALDRLSLNYRKNDFTLDLGRQRLAWGTTFNMSFMDMFHPLRPGNPFVPEQPGTDSVRIQYADGMVSGYDLIYAWFDDEGSEAVAGSYHAVFGDYESSISAGRIRGEDFIGFATSGDINDVGVRIEAAWWDSDVGEPFRLALESDYAPNSSTYLSGEIFYNGPGATGILDYDGDAIASGELYPARWYGAVNCSYNPGGLSTLGLVGLFNLVDDSWFADVSIQHSLWNTADLRIGFQHYEGRTFSEYGALPDIIYIMTTRYF